MLNNINVVKTKFKKISGIIFALIFVLLSTNVMAADDDSTNHNTPTNVQSQDDGAHIWGAWSVEIESTCITKGIEYRVCTRYPSSPHVEFREIPLGEHNYIKTVIAPQCEKDGATVYKCEICGDEYFEPIKALEHSYGDWIITKVAKPGVLGEKEKVCLNNCGKKIVETYEITITEEIPENSQIKNQVLDSEVNSEDYFIETLPTQESEQPSKKSISLEKINSSDDLTIKYIENSTTKDGDEQIQQFIDELKKDQYDAVGVALATGSAASTIFFGVAIYWDYMVISWSMRKRKQMLKKKQK